MIIQCVNGVWNWGKSTAIISIKELLIKEQDLLTSLGKSLQELGMDLYVEPADQCYSIFALDNYGLLELSLLQHSSMVVNRSFVPVLPSYRPVLPGTLGPRELGHRELALAPFSGCRGTLFLQFYDKHHAPVSCYSVHSAYYTPYDPMTSLCVHYYCLVSRS